MQQQEEDIAAGTRTPPCWWSTPQPCWEYLCSMSQKLLLCVCVREVEKLSPNSSFSRGPARGLLTAHIHRPAYHLHPIALKWSLSGPWALCWRPAQCWISAPSPGLLL